MVWSCKQPGASPPPRIGSQLFFAGNETSWKQDQYFEDKYLLETLFTNFVYLLNICWICFLEENCIYRCCIARNRAMPHFRFYLRACRGAAIWQNNIWALFHPKNNFCLSFVIFYNLVVEDCSMFASAGWHFLLLTERKRIIEMVTKTFKWLWGYFLQRS